MLPINKSLLPNFSCLLWDHCLQLTYFLVSVMGPHVPLEQHLNILLFHNKINNHIHILLQLWPSFLSSNTIEFHERVIYTLILHLFPPVESSASEIWFLATLTPLKLFLLKPSTSSLLLNLKTVSTSHDLLWTLGCVKGCWPLLLCYLLLPGLQCCWTLWVFLPALWWLFLLCIYILIFCYLWQL